MFGETDLLRTLPGPSAAATAIRLDGRRPTKRVGDWDSLAEPLQVLLAGAALRRAAAAVAFQAETLAREMEAGSIEDCGGPDALRLLCAIVRIAAEPRVGGD